MKKPLPFAVAVDDYHEFADVQDYMRMLDTQIKVREIGFDGEYKGIVYKGRLTDPKVKKLIKEIKADCKAYDEDIGELF